MRGPTHIERVSYAVSSMLRVLAIAFLATACGDEQLERMTAIKDEVCACKTPACGQTAIAKMGEVKVKADRKAQRLARAMLDCMAKLNEAGRPTTDPDADLPPTSPGSADPASAGTP